MYEPVRIKYIEYAVQSGENCLIGGFKMLQSEPFRQDLTNLCSYKKMIKIIADLEKSNNDIYRMHRDASMQALAKYMELLDLKKENVELKKEIAELQEYKSMYEGLKL